MKVRTIDQQIFDLAHVCWFLIEDEVDKIFKTYDEEDLEDDKHQVANAHMFQNRQAMNKVIKNKITPPPIQRLNILAWLLFIYVLIASIYHYFNLDNEQSSIIKSFKIIQLVNIRIANLQAVLS